MSSWLTQNQNVSVFPPDFGTFEVLAHIQKCAPALSAEVRRSVLADVESEVRQLPRMKRDKTTIQLLVEASCREARQRSLTSIEQCLRASKDPYEPGPPLTRDAVLRATAAAALDPMPYEYERCNSKTMELDEAGDIAIVDLTTLHPEGEFSVAIFDWNFFTTDFRRLAHRLSLRNGHLHVKTTKEVSQNGKRIPRFVPVRSIVAALKFGRNYDSIFLTSESINKNLLDLRKVNTRIPALTDSEATRLANEKFSDGMWRWGSATSPAMERLTVDALFAKPKAVPFEQDKTAPSWVKTQSQQLQEAYAKLSAAEKKLKGKAAKNGGSDGKN